MIGSQINIRLLVAKMNSSFQYSTNAPRVNNTFSPKRFGYLLREMIVEKRIFFLGLFVALSAFHLIVGFIFGFPYAYPDFRGVIAVTCSLVGTFVIALFLTKRFEKSAIGIRHFRLLTS
jgi:hypothetical protein